ncbi:hypothetical protein BJ508DRAFT_313581 [Ascobolus immersus RN42]|uniref:Uncharacterized protein n=1 Tax=Ascobolus immersus RN42 TaxID=1160509 RepID=A0A3N4HID6_ASCIM|nr:hypothetical protein BJ508DRAFT_313581 [Ascobolus immersus RN42]
MPPRKKTPRQLAKQKLEARTSRIEAKRNDFLVRHALFKQRVELFIAEFCRINPSGMGEGLEHIRAPPAPVYAPVTASNVADCEKELELQEDWIGVWRSELVVFEQLFQAQMEGDIAKMMDIVDEAAADGKGGPVREIFRNHFVGLKVQGVERKKK